MILQFFANGIVAGAIFSIVGLGFALVYNTTKTFHIAYAAVYVASAYALYYFFKVAHFPLFLSLFLGVCFGALLNVLIEILVYRPVYLRRSPVVVSLISSIGCYVVLTNLVALLFGNDTKVLSTEIERSFQSGNVILTRMQIIEILVFVLFFCFYSLLLRRTSFGKLIRAFADNPELLSMCGVRILNLRTLIFGLSGLFVGTASCLTALDVGMDPYAGMPILLIAMVSLIIGGVGIFKSAVLGGFLIGIIQNLIVWKVSARWQDCITFLLLVLFLLFKPQGILGIKNRLEEK